MKADKQRVEWIDSAKAISILLVTLLHAAQLSEAAQLSVHFVTSFNKVLTPIRMPLFFAASGVFAGAALRKPWPFILEKRVGLYIWLFFIWSVIRWTVSAYIVSNPDNPSEGGTLTEIPLALVMPTTGLWFLWSLALFFMASKILMAISRPLSVVISIVGTIIALDLIQLHKGIMPENLAYNNTITYFSFFYVAAAYPNAIFSLGRLTSASSAAAGFGVLFVLCLVVGKLIPVTPVAGAFLFASSAAGVAALFQAARLLDNTKVTRTILRYIGKNTLPIYVVQVPILSAFVFVLVKLGARNLGIWNNLLMPLLVILLVIFALIIRNLFLKAHLDWLYTLPLLGHSRVPRLPTAEISVANQR